MAKTIAILSVKKLFKRKTSLPPSTLNFSVTKLIILSSYYVFARYKIFTEKSIAFLRNRNKRCLIFRKSNTLAVHLTKAKKATNLKEINVIKDLTLEADRSQNKWEN